MEHLQDFYKFTMNSFLIDINCDVGEGMGNESLLFPYISSCNIACGGHAGDHNSMETTARLALEQGVHIGAHPSYPDRENFGRRSMKISESELQISIENQIESLLIILKSLQTPLHHIKAHGALYNNLAKGGRLAEIYLEVLIPHRTTALLFAPCGSYFADLAASKGFKVWKEAFADRAYETDGSLVSRTKPGSVHTEPKEVFNQLRVMVLEKRVPCADSSYFSLDADTFCLHGDTPNAVEILAYITKALPGESIRIKKK